MSNIVIIGASGSGKEVASLIEEINSCEPLWNIVGFVDDSFGDIPDKCLGYPVLGTLEYLNENESIKFAAVGIGDPRVRKSIIDRLADSNISYPSLVHPGVSIHRTISIGDGAIVCAGSILTVEIEVGRHVHVNTDCTIGHGSQLGGFSTLSPGVHIPGDVIIEAGVFWGTGAQAIPGISIGEGAIIGAGATVTKSISAGVLAVGAPAKPIKKISPF